MSASNGALRLEGFGKPDDSLQTSYIEMLHRQYGSKLTSAILWEAAEHACYTFGRGCEVSYHRFATTTQDGYVWDSTLEFKTPRGTFAIAFPPLDDRKTGVTIYRRGVERSFISRYLVCLGPQLEALLVVQKMRQSLEEEERAQEKAVPAAIIAACVIIVLGLYYCLKHH